MTVNHTRWTLASAACAAVVLAPIFSNAQSSVEAGDNTGRNLTKQAQSEINISVEVTERAAAQDEGDGGASPSVPDGTPFDQFMRRFFNKPLRNPGEKTMALGSGFVIDPAGYVVTNNHVVANAQKVNVTFQDNIQHQAKVLGRDERTDLALLKLDTNQQLPYVTWGNSDDAKVGDWVVAVGNPFGLGGTVTAGIISALGRNINEGPYDDFLQIDAPINRGNSGGPTFTCTAG